LAASPLSLDPGGITAAAVAVVGRFLLLMPLLFSDLVKVDAVSR
jgi:hypothetical protein